MFLFFLQNAFLSKGIQKSELKHVEKFKQRIGASLKMNVNKKELVDSIAQKTTLTKSQIRQVVDEAFEFITRTISKGGKVQIVGFGSFQLKKRTQRYGMNPRTGERIRIDEKDIPVFTPGKKLVSLVNDRKRR
jgi:DNA-binding protein HU-beta